MKTLLRAQVVRPDEITTIVRDVHKALKLKIRPIEVPVADPRARVGVLPDLSNPRPQESGCDAMDILSHLGESHTAMKHKVADGRPRQLAELRQDGNGGLEGYHGSQIQGLPLAVLEKACAAISAVNDIVVGYEPELASQYEIIKGGVCLPTSSKQFGWLMEHTVAHRNPHDDVKSRSMAKRSGGGKAKPSVSPDKVRTGGGRWRSLGGF